MKNARYYIQRARNAANGAVSTLAEALERPDDNLEAYIEKWADSICADLSSARLELNKAMGEILAAKQSKES